MDAAGATIVVGRPGDRNGLFGGFAIYQAFLNEWIQVTGGPIYGVDNAQGPGDFAEQYPLREMLVLVAAFVSMPRGLWSMFQHLVSHILGRSQIRAAYLFMNVQRVAPGLMLKSFVRKW